ncbi:hypothetical protein HanRHA438_Chr02g0088591 [Helianthus annuus]|nr:hypothetical protein HanRHA438_Chr02g0088591 [Helianthus annuus]
MRRALKRGVHICPKKRSRRYFLMKSLRENKHTVDSNVCVWSAWDRHERS